MKILLRILTILLSLLMLVIFAAPYITPGTIRYVAVLPMLLPAALIATAILCVIWIFVNYKVAIVLAIITAIGLRYNSHIYSFGNSASDEESEISLLTYNVKLFGFFEPDNDSSRMEYLDVINRSGANILCMQEAYCHDKKNKFETLSEIKNATELKYVAKAHTAYFNYGQSNLIVMSQYPIVGQGSCISKKVANGFMYADIKIDEDTVRIYNCHLQSLRIVEDDIEFDTSRDSIVEKDVDKLRDLYRKYYRASILRSKQVQELKLSVDSCQYMTVICGDFNDVPLSSTSFKVLDMKHGFKDTFMEKGQGTGATFDLKNHGLRIDYVYHDKNFECLEHTVIGKNVANDHYPLFTRLRIK